MNSFLTSLAAPGGKTESPYHSSLACTAQTYRPMADIYEHKLKLSLENNARTLHPY